MNVYRCLICGDSYIGGSSQSSCPFCGAHEQYMVKIEKWQDLNEGLKLTDITRANVEKALKIELENADFYKSAAEKALMDNKDEIRSIFRALFKVESEHASVFKKFLKDAIPDYNIKETAFNSSEDNFKESLRREELATKFYQAAHDKASEKRAKQVFKALVEVESDHIALDKEHL